MRQLGAYRRPWSGPDRERGSATLELAILAPVLLLLLGLVVLAGRVQVAAGAVEHAAMSAAREASLARTVDGARATASSAAARELDGQDIIYKNFYHIGVAVGTEKGLVVPVIRDADALGLAGIEKTISDFGKRARDGQLKIEEMQGGTFTITNGGIYGSLMSTPILNAPQSGILGMHKIQERPMAVGGKIEIRPMMYLALSYDHRVIDGKEAVTFLVRVKENLEDPARLVLDL